MQLSEERVLLREEELGALRREVSERRDLRSFEAPLEGAGSVRRLPGGS